MNPRRVHKVMTENFPTVDLAKRSWVNLLESDGTLRRDVLAALLGSSSVLMNCSLK